MMNFAVRWHGGGRGAIAPAVNFLWLLSLLQGKESNNIVTKSNIQMNLSIQK